MAVKLRLKRMGTKKRPFYRIVAADSRSPRDGKFIELVGTYNPITNPAELKVNEEVAMKWLNNGAVPTDTVRNLFKQAGINKKIHEAKMTKTVKKEVKEPKKETVKKEVVKAPKKETTKKTTTTKKAPAKTTKKVEK